MDAFAPKPDEPHPDPPLQGEGKGGVREVENITLRHPLSLDKLGTGRGCDNEARVLSKKHVAPADVTIENKTARLEKAGCQDVGPTGLEPVTLCLEGRCSIHLSYGPKNTR